MCPELRLLNIYIVENALHCKTLYCMKVSLSVSVYITVWVNRGNYLAKSVMQMKDVSRGFIAVCPVPGQHEAVTARGFLPLYTARTPSLRTVCATQSHDPR